MKERPIPFSAPMVRALLAGTKTQTRRVVKKLPWFDPPGNRWYIPLGQRSFKCDTEREAWQHMPKCCPYGQPGARLWVRETFAKIDGQTQPWIETDYRATYTHGDRLGDTLGIKKRWTPAIHMPRAASRITLELTGVRVERLQDISEADARAEGAAPHNSPAAILTGYRQGYRLLWDSINGPGAWGSNPWVWVVEFRRLP